MSREQIRKDLEKVEKGIAHLITNERDNHEVPEFDFADDYIRPYFDTDITMPLEHPHGFFAYLNNLRSVLFRAYRTGIIQEDELPAAAPKYLEDLIR